MNSVEGGLAEEGQLVSGGGDGGTGGAGHFFIQSQQG